jgi:hypothetical protein
MHRPAARRFNPAAALALHPAAPAGRIPPLPGMKSDNGTILAEVYLKPGHPHAMSPAGHSTEETAKERSCQTN